MMRTVMLVVFVMFIPAVAAGMGEKIKPPKGCWEQPTCECVRKEIADWEANIRHVEPEIDKLVAQMDALWSAPGGDRVAIRELSAKLRARHTELTSYHDVTGPVQIKLWRKRAPVGCKME